MFFMDYLFVPQNNPDLQKIKEIYRKSKISNLVTVIQLSRAEEIKFIAEMFTGRLGTQNQLTWEKVEAVDMPMSDS